MHKHGVGGPGSGSFCTSFYFLGACHASIAVPMTSHGSAMACRGSPCMAFVIANHGTTVMESHASCHGSLNGLPGRCPWQATAAARHTMASPTARHGKSHGMLWQALRHATASCQKPTSHVDPIRMHPRGRDQGGRWASGSSCGEQLGFCTLWEASGPGGIRFKWDQAWVGSAGTPVVPPCRRD